MRVQLIRTVGTEPNFTNEGGNAAQGTADTYRRHRTAVRDLSIRSP